MVEHRDGIGVYNAIASLPVWQGVARFSYCDSSTCPYDNSMERVYLSTGNGDYQHTRSRVRRSVCAGLPALPHARALRGTHTHGNATRHNPADIGRTAQEIPRRRTTDYANAQTTLPAARQSSSNLRRLREVNNNVLFCLRRPAARPNDLQRATPTTGRAGSGAGRPTGGKQ